MKKRPAVAAASEVAPKKKTAVVAAVVENDDGDGTSDGMNDESVAAAAANEKIEAEAEAAPPAAAANEEIGAEAEAAPEPKSPNKPKDKKLRFYDNHPNGWTVIRVERGGKKAGTFYRLWKAPDGTVYETFWKAEEHKPIGFVHGEGLP